MRPVDRLLLGVLGLDGFLVGLLSAAFTDFRAGSLMLPISPVVGAFINCLLLYLAALYTDDTRLRLIPLAGWVIAAAVMLVGGPGGDVVMLSDWRTLIFIVFGAGLPAIYLWSARLPVPGP